MKIAMIGQKGIPATYGGVERHVEELSARLVQSGHEVTAYCRRHYTHESETHRGVRLQILPSINTKHLDAISHTMLSVLDALRNRFDVIHFHAMGPSILSFIPRAFSPDTAIVATVHALDWRRRKWGAFARWSLRRGEWTATRFPHRTIVVSRLLASHFEARGRKVIHIPNGVPPATRKPIQELAKFGLEGHDFVLWLGRFVPEKRVEDLIHAFRDLPGELRLLLAGEMEEGEPYFRSLRAAAQGNARVIFTGGLYGGAKAEALSHARLVVMPSELEGFPIALLEAMRYARPVLASNIPEHLEIVAPGSNGFVFTARDAEALRKRMKWILDNRSAAEAAGDRAEKDARHYDWDSIASQTEAVYRDAVNECRMMNAE